jgi:hypothetical protein
VIADVHGEYAVPSRLHWNVELGFELVKEKVALASDVVPLGPAVIVVRGGAVSMVQVRVAPMESVLPSASVAYTLNVWLPSARLE